VTSQGHPYATYRRAIDRKQLPAAWAAAHDLGRLNLADALDLVLLVAEQEANKYPRVALRWHARYCAERDVTLAEAQAVLALLVLVDEAASAAALGSAGVGVERIRRGRTSTRGVRA
jgi:hypothetical protein